MSNKAKDIAAVGSYSGCENVEADLQERAEALEKLEAMLEGYEMGDAIAESDLAQLQSLLPVIGAENVRLSDDGALVGEGDFDFEASGFGCYFATKGYLGSEGHGEGRTDMWLSMDVEKLNGTVGILSYKFVFNAYSFGTGPSGAVKLLFKREFERSFDQPNAAAGSYYDLSTNTQTGFLYTAKCIVQTTEGHFTIR